MLKSCQKVCQTFLQRVEAFFWPSWHFHMSIFSVQIALLYFYNGTSFCEDLFEPNSGTHAPKFASEPSKVVKKCIVTFPHLWEALGRLQQDFDFHQPELQHSPVFQQSLRKITTCSSSKFQRQCHLFAKVAYKHKLAFPHLGGLCTNFYVPPQALSRTLGVIFTDTLYEWIQNSRKIVLNSHERDQKGGKSVSSALCKVLKQMDQIYGF
jgi:hypothetical protein